MSTVLYRRCSHHCDYKKKFIKSPCPECASVGFVKVRDFGMEEAVSAVQLSRLVKAVVVSGVEDLLRDHVAEYHCD